MRLTGKDTRSVKSSLTRNAQVPVSVSQPWATGVSLFALPWQLDVLLEQNKSRTMNQLEAHLDAPVDERNVLKKVTRPCLII